LTKAESRKRKAVTIL